MLELSTALVTIADRLAEAWEHYADVQFASSVWSLGIFMGGAALIIIALAVICK